MKKEKTYNEAVDGDEGFVPGEGYPSCDGEPCANVSDDSQDGTDTMADAAEGGDKAGAGSDLTAALAEWQDKFIRLQAEFDNYRKRTLKEKMDLVQTGGRDVLLAMLPVRDDVQRAVDAMQKSDDIEALRAGVMLISQKFTDTLRQKGVTEIDVKGNVTRFNHIVNVPVFRCVIRIGKQFRVFCFFFCKELSRVFLFFCFACVQHFYCTCTTHYSNFGCRPCVVHITTELLTAHHDVRATVRLTQSDSYLRYSSFTISIQQFGAMEDNAVILLTCSRKESRYVYQ